ncbi:NitT/TauT family transport system substrate-binding protein [Treponema bryantii]|uniref:NitT/TauT family transport system substrate-binding protein n=1 Tax=Treponema bryantii TaxID=163 RepID=A0A1I3K480_9SPIR|nr:ABC transporter substrate-binding protein [Treponema bryantii]SFI67292.1 NitT/TauT family transport system substrate-binding protein [Treponema bryantii]
MKRITTFVIALLIATAAFAESIHVGVLNGPTCIPAAYMIENNKTISAGDTTADVTYEKFADPQALLPKLIKKEVDIGFMPVNVAAKVYNSGNKSLLLCAVTGLGNLSLITTDESVKSFSDLKGKTVYVAGQGATPEYMFRYILDENKISYSTDGSSADVQIDFSIPTAQIAAQMISGKIQYAVVPEPFATIAQTKSESVKRTLNLQNEYLALSGAKEIYPLSVMVVRADFTKENKELFEAFLSEYEKSAAWTVANPAEAGKLTEKAELGLAAGVVTKAIPVSNYVYIPADKAKKQIEAMLSIFLKCDKTSIGGKLPDKNFYYGSKKK